MRVLLDIKDSKAVYLMEVLKGLSYVKTKTISNEKAILIEEVKEAVDNLNLAKEGKLKLKTARELYNEL
jgi:penicillin-binding protein-related factor A (putative recombinase)